MRIPYEIYLLSLYLYIPLVHGAAMKAPRTLIEISPTTTLISIPTSGALSPTISTNTTIPTRTLQGMGTGKELVTPAPEIPEGGLDKNIQEKWHLTTFYSCHTFDATYVDCGIHEPMLPGGDEIAAGVRLGDSWGLMWTAVVIVAGALL